RRTRNRLPRRVRDVATRGAGDPPNGDRPPCQGESRGQRDRRDPITPAGRFVLPAGVFYSTPGSNVVSTTGGAIFFPPPHTSSPRPHRSAAAAAPPLLSAPGADASSRAGADTSRSPS